MISPLTDYGKERSRREEDKMPLKDFLDYVQNHPDEILTWELGGRAGTYKGILTLVEKQSMTLDLKPIGKPYTELELKGNPTVLVCSSEAESKFSSTHAIRDGKIITLEAAA